jgi:hypothetical protein
LIFSSIDGPWFESLDHNQIQSTHVVRQNWKTLQSILGIWAVLIWNLVPSDGIIYHTFLL